MKDLVLTRKLKQALSEHFSKGGTVTDVQGDLKRVSMQDRQKCFDYWKSKQC